MSKTKLSSTLAKQKLIELKNLYQQPPNPNIIPNKLYHYVRENQRKLIEEAINKIKKDGLKVANPRDTTSIIDDKTQRPAGIYFWGQPIKDEIHIEVEIDDLNLNQLYAFPHQIADTILKINQNYILPNNFWAKLKKIAQPIPFSEYKGQFRAEFIYTVDISPELLKINSKPLVTS
ncbi:hypothetical protein Halha_1918 [Halobacteroides halobius DSM 5150]|uniref:Uncharacterized protein n=1 Tax=Halobacteroides halobius (strain ATCC 35273 / DSM 5150 / MD-1) TaxID=748449 RepID=L0KBU8_HALHC|nr:hypothetical protein [Halobacteroides halobius]AGB41829.1 hypothetical protein Halha_1918 [Halobacteroides halobius DSM 5150]